MKADVVLLAPPWGGVDYSKKEVFRLEDLPAGLDGRELFALARKLTKNVVFLLPRNVDRRQVAELGDEGEVVEVVEGMIDGVVKMVIVYFGALASSPTKVNMILSRFCSTNTCHPLQSRCLNTQRNYRLAFATRSISSFFLMA